MIDIIASQIPVIPEFTQSVRAQWNFSRHPENYHDIVESARATELDASERNLTKASVGAIALAGGPINEVLLTLGVGNALKATDSIAPAIAAVGPITGPMELASGLGLAYLANKFPEATNIVKDRYIKVNDDIERSGKKPTEPKQLARTLGVVSFTGTGSAGATLEYELHDPVDDGGYTRNKKVAKIAAGMLVGINIGYVGAILGATKGVEAAGATSATEVVANSTSNPLIIGGIMASALIAKQQYNIVKHSIKMKKDAKKTRIDMVNQSDELLENNASASVGMSQ